MGIDAHKEMNRVGRDGSVIWLGGLVLRSERGSGDGENLRRRTRLDGPSGEDARHVGLHREDRDGISSGPLHAARAFRAITVSVIRLYAHL
jgi:hypothetical protein